MNKEMRLGRSERRVNKSWLQAFTTWCVSLGKVFLFSFQTEAFSLALKGKQPEQWLRCFCYIMLGLFTNWLAVFYSAVCHLFCGIRIAQNLAVSSAWCLLSEVSERIPYTSIKEAHFKMGTKSKVTISIQTALSWFTNVAANGVLGRK